MSRPSLAQLRLEAGRDAVLLAQKLGVLQNALFDGAAAPAADTTWNLGKTHGACGIAGNMLSALAVLLGISCDEAYALANASIERAPVPALAKPPRVPGLEAKALPDHVWCDVDTVRAALPNEDSNAQDAFDRIVAAMRGVEGP